MSHKPANWGDLEDGLYGDVDAFMEEYESGAQARRWAWLVKDNALDEHKIKLWLSSLERPIDASVA